MSIKSSFSTSEYKKPSQEESWGQGLQRNGRINALRDVTWVGASGAGIGGTKFWDQTAAQCGLSAIPTLLYALGETIYCKINGTCSSEKLREIWARPIAVLTAIGTWNAGQGTGTHLGKIAFPNSPLFYGSSLAGGLIAAPFAGMFEGFTQWAVKYVIDVATNPVKREMWRQDPGLMTKLLIKEFLLNITIGAIPGAVWQLAYFFLLPILVAALGGPWGILVLAVIVCVAVALSNYTCAHAIRKVSDWIDKQFGWDEALASVEESADQIIGVMRGEPEYEEVVAAFSPPSSLEQQAG